MLFFYDRMNNNGIFEFLMKERRCITMNPKKMVQSFFERVYNQRDYEYVMTLFSDDYYEHTKNGARSNKDACSIIKNAISVFPDLKVQINNVIAENDIVAVRLTFSITHKGEFFGIQATSKKIVFEAMEFFKVADDKIIESWGSWPIFDILEKMKQ
jgi:steroid delta-isomerase-like uncharacterized protein